MTQVLLRRLPGETVFVCPNCGMAVPPPYSGHACNARTPVKAVDVAVSELEHEAPELVALRRIVEEQRTEIERLRKLLGYAGIRS